MITRFFWLVLMFAVSPIVKGEKVYDFNSTCQQAYNEITKLRIGKGSELIELAKQENPNNLIPYMLEGYVDFFVLFFNEDQEEYNRRKDNFSLRQDRYEAGPKNSPFYNYCRALNLLQRASVRIKFGERFGAVFDFKKGYSLIKDNRKDYPSFLPNNLVYAPLQVVLGTVPDGYKVYTSLFGMKGSIKDGMQLMRNFLNSQDPMAKIMFNEAVFYYAYLAFYIENKPDEVMSFLQQRKLDMVNNHLFAYLGTNLGLNSKNTAYAKKVMLNKNDGPEYLKTPVWDFELAYARLYNLDLPGAAASFNSFVDSFKGRFYVKDALLKLSWTYYLLGDTSMAERTLLRVLKEGATDSDADKKALKDAKSKVWPDQTLLKARLLSDGGYNNEALQMLASKRETSYTNTSDKLEYVYRMARILDDLNRDTEAIERYQAAIKIGSAMREYYAARAALQIGYIYEKRGQKALAIAYFQKCLDMPDHEYKDSLDQRAKSGIARCQGQ